MKLAHNGGAGIKEYPAKRVKAVVVSISKEVSETVHLTSEGISQQYKNSHITSVTYDVYSGKKSLGRFIEYYERGNVPPEQIGQEVIGYIVPKQWSDQFVMTHVLAIK